MRKLDGNQIQFRKPKFNMNGGIDCEINHPDFGWIPFTAAPNDFEEHGRVIHERLASLPPGAVAVQDGDNGPAK